MESNELDNDSKNGLMESIRARLAEEVNSHRIVGTIFLAILIMNLFYYAGSLGKNWTYYGAPAFIVIFSIAESWWKKRMIKCNDAKELESIHKRYIIYHKIDHIAALVFLVLIAYPLYKDCLGTTSPEFSLALLGVIWAVAFCLILRRLLKLKKSPVDQEIERLQELIENDRSGK